MPDSEIKYDSENETDNENDSETDIDINYHLYESIKETFEAELYKIFKNIAKKYGEEYMFSKDDLLKFYKTFNLELYYKKSPPKKYKVVEEHPDKIRCCGRVWAGGYMEGKQFGDRCQRKRIDGSDYCKQHTDNLVHGRFDDEPPVVVKGFYIKQNDKSYNANDNDSD
jgi:hypothetical protein